MSKHDRVALVCLLALCTLPAEAQSITLNGDGRSVSLPSPSNGDVVVKDDLISLYGGLISLRIPAGWSQQPIPDSHVGIKADRYASVPSNVRWAECRVMIQRIVITNGATQAYTNARLTSVEPKVVADARKDGTLVEHTTTGRIGDVAVTRSIFAHPARSPYPGWYDEISDFMVAQDGKLAITHIACNIARPEQEQDKRDIRAFLDSAQINRPS